MAKASNNKSTKSPSKRTPAKRATAVRNTAVPRKTAASRNPSRIPTHEEIAQRAFEIYLSGTGGSEQENWHRAERELRG